MYSDFLFLVPALVGFLFLLWLRKPKRKTSRPQTEERPPQNAILVDGSNVMHWGGEPSAQVLSMVLRSLEDHGFAPIVFFDANVGYVLADRYYNEAMLAPLIGVPSKHICVVDKGVVADEVILAFSADHGMRVVTNDQFRDWRVQFPHAAKRGQLVRGDWKNGSIVWRVRMTGPATMLVPAG